MTKWEILQSYLTPTLSFDSLDVAAALGVTGPEASSLIQAYLRAQRSPYSTTLYVLHRTGRTRMALWHVGARTNDARELMRQTAYDFMATINDAAAPSLRRMGILNPRAAQQAEAMVGVLEANMNLLISQLP